METLLRTVPCWSLIRELIREITRDRERGQICIALLRAVLPPAGTHTHEYWSVRPTPLFLMQSSVERSGSGKSLTAYSYLLLYLLS